MLMNEKWQDAFNDAINQCIYSNQPGGFYTYNNAVFNIQPITLVS